MIRYQQVCEVHVLINRTSEKYCGNQCCRIINQYHELCQYSNSYFVTVDKKYPKLDFTHRNQVLYNLIDCHIHLRHSKVINGKWEFIGHHSSTHILLDLVFHYLYYQK